jgi:biofilm PGA synthesis N-glycosyltransferase PgaC
MHNIVESTYPRDRYELILVDDKSSDRTAIRAEEVLSHLNVSHTILVNEERMGTNRSYNRAIENARYDIIVTSDADVFFAPDALEILIARLMSDDSVATVCSDLQPSASTSSMNPGKMEGIYRNYYGRMCEWESAVDSTYNFNGALVAFKKDIVQRIDDKRGADDANTAFEAIRRGYRAIYERHAVVVEEIPDELGKQFRQKRRRATRLIEATISNLDLLRKKRPFSRFFYPLRILMYMVSPVLFFIGGLLCLIGMIIQSAVLGAAMIVLIGFLLVARPKTFIVAFIYNQFYLLSGLLNLGKDMRIWDSTSKKGYSG